ncbi:hypothetical protein Ahy_B03g066778 [Arachis hypogaea]|uniref:MULE transposase domain-containing protein n=1 Tax=Arachis hypogaea TaxID=3818 RepID=A0A445A4X9_ARAHY|nr:hypothetical protein Ahy_B03g066778 [Arachis hypogaea]
MLYGKYDGVLLVAVAQDDNNNTLPVAFAIVESETTESCPSNTRYKWYIDALRGLSRELTNWASRFNKKIWLQHCDSSHRFGHMTTNLSECMNTVLKDMWYLPISAIVKCTYKRLHQLFVRKSREAQGQRVIIFLNGC